MSSSPAGSSSRARKQSGYRVLRRRGQVLAVGNPCADSFIRGRKTMAAPWERWPGESAKAYAAFCLFRDLGPGRSLDAASRSYHHPGLEAQQPPRRRLPRASGTIRRWAHRWSWLDRARAWDQETERLKQVEQLAAIQD